MVSALGIRTPVSVLSFPHRSGHGFACSESRLQAGARLLRTAPPPGAQGPSTDEGIGFLREQTYLFGGCSCGPGTSRAPSVELV